MRDANFSRQILAENHAYAMADTGATEQMTLKAYVEYCAENDPTFYGWLINEENVSDYGSGMTDEQAREALAFIESL